MSAQAPDVTADERYAELELQDGSVVIYDRENPTAWLQSDTTVKRGELA